MNPSAPVLFQDVAVGWELWAELDSAAEERSWSTIGVSENIIEASWEALSDAYLYGVVSG